MKRKWYKTVEGVQIEAPQSVETSNGAVIYNYNCDSNEAMLRADGYLPENEITVIDQQINKSLDERVKGIEEFFD